MNSTQAHTFSTHLLTWYQTHGRHDLPWQHNPTPYRVWISEIMLQQTQVATVIPYYLRFMQSFPTLKSLSLAKEDDVLSHWSGLGYYARARNIVKTAKIIAEKYRGRFPKTVEEICNLPGIGQSTAGAIFSFSQRKRAVILDGNVKRVLARYFAISQPINQKNTLDEMWLLAEKLTPEKNAHHYNQAIMDLGATVCTRSKPQCSACPFRKNCEALNAGTPTQFPIKSGKKTRPTKHVVLYIIRNMQNEIALIKRPTKGIWGGLWSFPEYWDQESEIRNQYKFQNRILQPIGQLPQIKHQFTHFTLMITPVLCKPTKKITSNELFWYKLDTRLPGGIAAPVANILKQLNAEAAIP